MSSIRTVAPDIYSAFSCKCGDCRSTCCSAWGISVSDTEYFRLLGCDCSPELRRRLDCAFVPAEPPSPERYAFLAPGYTGNCRLLSESGLCSLQVECGEGAIPLICRVYPRAIRRMDGWYELSTSLACEKTAELLFASPEPLSFVEAVSPPPYHSIAGGRSDEAAMRERQELLAILSDRSQSLYGRIIRISERVLRRPLPRARDGEAIAERILSVALPILDRHVESGHLQALASRARAALADAPSPAAALLLGGERLRALLPDPERYIERLLVHHMFHMQLPYADSPQTPEEQICSFLVACDLLTFFLLCLPFASLSDAVDAVSALFRFLEHSGYYFSHRNGALSLLA